uniref:Uncharacterized protein n=1 Tax=Candidatus Methanogaster sp. ANME-2c ERB4 TaxID=2759911 RepID=A0A7G9YGQ9_9EURY|nr:hypothetical protein FLPJBPEJ_00037 [Methanosarcinales archaeon ANME-2c ERB4]
MGYKLLYQATLADSSPPIQDDHLRGCFLVPSLKETKILFTVDEFSNHDYSNADYYY